jgi:hypothetical protein
MTKIAVMLLVAASILAGCKTGEDLVLPNQSRVAQSVNP